MSLQLLLTAENGPFEVSIRLEPISQIDFPKIDPSGRLWREHGGVKNQKKLMGLFLE